MNNGTPKSTVGPVPPKIEIVKPATPTTFAIGAGDPVAAQTEIGLWDNAAELTPTPTDPRRFTSRNDVIEQNNFVGGDSRRFYIRVTDPSAKGRQFLEDNVEWWTSFENDDKRAKTEDDPPSKLSLFEAGKGTGVFVSKGLMIVNDQVDRRAVMNSGVPPGHPLFAKHGGNRNDQQSNYRIRRAGMFSFVVASYLAKSAKTPVKSAVTPVFLKKNRFLPVQVYIVRKSPKGPPSISPQNVFEPDLRVVTQTYERIGLWTYTDVSEDDQKNPNIEKVTASTGIPYRVCVIDPPAGVNTAKVGEDTLFQIAKAFPGSPNTLRLFYIEQFFTTKGPGALFGVSFGPTYVPPAGSVFGPIAPAPQKVGASFIAGNFRDPYTAAHELGHILTDKTTNGGHYSEPAPVGGFVAEENLMFEHSRGATEDLDQTKRLWDVFEPDFSGIPLTQRLRILGSRFTR
jgi:hypothetical protein